MALLLGHYLPAATADDGRRVGISLVNSLKTFDIIWIMTQGGPYRSSETLAVTMYRETFVIFEHGYGAAISVVLSVIVVIVSLLYLTRTMRDA